ncbi:vacuolar protein sorting-associated protein 13 family protein [Trypanosoma conorhini]|uniref:Vacuolar protein sorting-associated protein 13 family protein n=1 Tax=Trypanosoma conorhini TaxID=83891 RepID=A0A3R7N1Y2_9TRYP|nr:vacuolar protein sorting-associated protein 13 family protein [Trypanosoma conorhini]RNF24081.1 vacuolar protein sorting-associated protein 13 family protein [Trypanosoma conorhini]
MLERQLSVLLATYLNRFICDLNEEQLRVSLWSGELVLRDLELRTNIVDQIALSLFQGRQEVGSREEADGGDAARATAQALMMPFTVVKGVVKELKISVPWSAVDREPISLEVIGVEIVFGLLRARPHNADEDAARFMAVKQKQLNTFEAGRLGGRADEGHELGMMGAPPMPGTGAERKKKLSYVEQLTETIKRNIHVVLRDVSLNYVVDYHGLAPCFTCALRVTLDSVYITTTDEEWEDRFIMDLSMLYCKKLVVGGLRVSLHAVKQQHGAEGANQKAASPTWRKAMNILQAEGITVLLHLPNPNYSADAVVEDVKRPVVSVIATAPIRLRASFGVVGFLTIINDSLKNGLLGLNYRQHLHLLSKDDEGTLTWPQRRWKFALYCVMDDVRRSKNEAKGHQRFIEGVVLFGRRRRKYCALWKRFQGVAWLPPLTTDERNTLHALEELLTVEQLVFLRCLAYAELTAERQSMRQQKLFIEEVKKRKQLVNESVESGSGRWWRWLGRGEASERAATAEPKEQEVVAGGGIEAEWAFGQKFLQQLATRRVGPFMASSSSAAAASASASASTVASTNPIVILLDLPHVDLEIGPDLWRSDMTKKKPLLSYLANLQQRLKLDLNDVKCKYAKSAAPQQDRVGFSLVIGSAFVGFTGSLSSVVLGTHDLRDGKKKHEEDSGQSGDIVRAPWMSINVNETYSLVSGFITTTLLTLQPLCELQWWVSGVREFIALLPEYTKLNLGPSCESPMPHCSSTSLPTVDIIIAGILLTTPLYADDGTERNLFLRVPDLHLLSIKQEEKEDAQYGEDERPNGQQLLMRASAPTMCWRFSMGGKEPICLDCEGVGDLLVLSFVKAEVVFSEQLSVFVRTRAKATVSPATLGLFHEHMKCLEFVEGNVGEALLCEVMNNDGKWRLKSSTALAVGGTAMTFPAARCRSFLRLLYRWAIAREVVCRKRAAPAAVDVALPLLHRVFVGVDFVHVTLRNANNEDVVEVELPGMEPSSYGTGALVPLSPARDAFILEMTSSGTTGYNTLICLPDLHVTAPSGQHVFVLEGLTATHNARSSLLSLAAEGLDVRLCRSLVDCVEVLLMSSALLRTPPSSAWLPLPSLEEAADRCVLPDATAHASRVMETTLKRFSLRFQFHRTEECVAVNLGDFSLRADSTSGRRTLNLCGGLDRVEYIAENGEEVKSFTLLAPSTGLRGSVDPASFTCALESRNDEVGDGGRSVVSFHTKGGRVGVFRAYWMRLLSMRYDPTVVSLLNLLGSEKRGCPAAPGVHAEVLQASAPAREAQGSPGLTVVAGEVTALELLLATDVAEEMDLLNTETYSSFFVETLTLRAEVSGGDEGRAAGGHAAAAPPPLLRGQLTLCGMSYFSLGEGNGAWFPLIPHASLLVENYTQLVPNADKSGYEYVGGGGGDMALHLLIGPPDSNAADAAAAAAVDIKLTLPWLNTLLRALAANIFSAVHLANGVQETEATAATPAAGKVTSTTAPSSRSTSVSFLVTVSSLRLVFIKEPDIFVIRAQLQFYSFSGVGEFDGATTSMHMVHVGKLTIDDISPNRRIMRRDIPQWQQHLHGVARDARASQKKRMFELESGCISTPTSQTGVDNTTLASATDLVFDGVQIYTARCSWTTLLGMLFFELPAGEWGAAKNSAPTLGSDVEAKSSVLTVTVHQLNLHLELPWEEPLAQLSAASVRVQLQQRDGDKTLEFSACEPISLTPTFEHAAEVNILEWVDASEETTQTRAPMPFLRIFVTQSCNNRKEYEFDTPYEEKPRVCYPNKVEATLQSMRLFADTKLMTRLARFALDEADAYSSLIPASKPVRAVPPMSLTMMDISVKDLQILFAAVEPAQAPSWRLTVEGVKVTNECVEEVLDGKSPAGMGSLGCFSNVYTMKLSGVFFACEGLYPLRFPNTVASAQLPKTQSVFTECRSTVSVTSDDRAHTRSTFVIVSPASLNDAQSRASFFKRIHIQTEDDACLSISALHVRDALRVLPPRVPPEEVPPYYTAPVSVDQASASEASLVSVNLPRFSIRLTESGLVKAEANAGKGEKKCVSGANLTTIAADAASLATLRFLGTVTLSAFFDSHEEALMRARFAINGPFELLDGNGVVVLFRRRSASLTEVEHSPPCQPPGPDDAGLRVEAADGPRERQVCLESHGIIVALQPHTVDFVLRMHNFIALMHREGFFAMEHKHSAGNTDAAQPSSSPVEKQTVLTIRVALLSLTMERTALMEARNVEARLSWKDGDSTPVDASTPYKIVIGNLLLRKMDSLYAFVCLSSLEVFLGVGEVNLRANKFVVNNYDMSFYAELWKSAEALYRYVLQNVTFSKKKEDGFKQSVMVTLTDVRVCFFLSRQYLVSEATNGRMEIVFPVVVLKQKACTAGRSLTLETENGVIRYRRPEGLLPPFVKNLSLSCFMENSLVTLSQSVVVHLSGVEAFIPLGDTLQCCVEAVAQAFLPLLSVSAAAHRNVDASLAPTAEVPATPLTCDRFVFTVPLVSLNVCALQSDDEALVEKPTVLFGVTLSNLMWEQSRTGVNEKVLAQVLSVTSTVDATFQKEFVSATAPSGALDEPSRWAVYFCKEISLSEAAAPLSQPHTDEGEAGGGDILLHEQLPTRLVSIIARAHAVRLTLSPTLLSTLNEHVLLHVASGVHRTRRVTASRLPSRPVRDAGALWSCSSVGDPNDRLLIIRGDYCLSTDLMLGGRRGSLLRFAKATNESASLNKIILKGVNHAKLFVSMFVAPDGSLKPPIVVDPGLTVVIEGVPFVTGGGKLMDYVELGARSLLLAPTELPTAADSGTPFPSLEAAAGVPLGTARWYNLQVAIDASTDVALSLWSEHQSIEVSGEAYARYRLEKNCYEGNRGVRDFIDEAGEVALSNVSILCDSGCITKDPTGLMVHVKHHKLKEDHTNAGMTVVRAILSTTSFTLSAGNLQLLYGTLKQLRQGLNHIGCTMELTATVEPAQHSDEEDNRKFVTSGKTYTGAVDYASSHAEPSLLWSREGEVTPLIEFAASAAWVELILTNDFYRPEVAVVLGNSALMAKGNRSLNRMKWTASTVVRVTDYPQLQPSRDVLLVSPEVAVEYARYTGGGFSLQGALTCPELSLTLPLVTALRLLRFRFDLQRSGAYSFLNCTGVPLLLLAVTQVNQTSPKARTQLCRLPPGKLVKTSLFHHNQTRFRVILDGKEEVDAYDENPGMFGTEVNLSALQRGATYRFLLSGPSIGALDAVMRLDEKERIVDITTSVEIKNELATHVVCLPGTPSDPCRVHPKETRYAPLPCLRHPFSLTVGEWRFKARNSLVTLESLVSAFTLLTHGEKGMSANAINDDVVVAPRRAYMEGDDTLVIPLTLEKEQHDEGLAEREEMRILLLLTRRVALESAPRPSRLLSRYEVELRVCPTVTLLNETGAVLAVNVVPSPSDAAAHTRTLLRGGEEFNFFSQCPEGEVFLVDLTCEFADGVQFSSVRPLPLTFRGTTAVAIKDPLGGKTAALLVEHAAHGKFIVRAAAILMNALPFPVRVYDASNALMPGQKDAEGLLPGHELPLTLPIFREQLRRRPDAAVTVRIAAGGPNAICSQLFTCNAPTVSGMLQTVDGDVVRIFRAQRLGGMKNVFTPTPAIRLEPLWVFRNQSHVFSLTVLSVGMTEPSIIEPQTTKEWTVFAVASASDPLLQLRYGGNGEELFMWSEPLKLVTLSGDNVPIAMRHQLHERVTETGELVLPPGVVEAGVAVYTSMRTPLMAGESPTCERFACLSITPWRKNGIFYVDFSLDGNVPVVVENRTGRSLQYEHVRKAPSASQQVARAYVVLPFTDGVTCFESGDTAHVMRLTLFDGKRPPQQCIVDLAKAAAARGAIKASAEMFVLCTYDYSIQRYYVSVTADRSLESRLLFQPQYIIHVETFIRALSLYIASICVPRDETALQASPLAALVMRNQLRVGRGITAEGSTNAEVLAALKCRELDLVLVQALGIYGVVSTNERHYFGRLDVGRLAVIDCTNPRPAYPVVMELNSEERRLGASDSKAVKPSLSVKMHALAPGEPTAVRTRERASGKGVTIPLQHLSLDVAPVTLKLTDSLLFLLRQAGVCAWEATQQTVPTRAAAEQVLGSGNQAGGPTSSSSSLEGIPIYNCRITHLHVSRIDLDLTLTRRSDGKFDPFLGMPLGSRFIPSVERAPLSISGVERMDVSQRGSSPYAALVALLWPSYRSQLMFQLYKVVGSLEILGNPIALLGGLRKGVQSFVVEVADMNPVKGAREFLLATTSSTLHTVGLLSRVGSRTAATLSWDNDWLEARGEDERSSDPLNRSGVLRGMAQGLRDGIEGVVARPLSGARATGLAGFCTGVATGAVGLLTRPVAGALDGFGNTAEFYSKLLQAADAIPGAHVRYLESGRNFIAAAVAPASEKIPAGGKSEAGSTNNSALVTPAGTVTGLTSAAEESLTRLGSRRRWATDDCEFMSQMTYDSFILNAKQEGLRGEDFVHFIKDTAGVHNYALYADWNSFVANTTPEEFYNWVHVALAAALAKEMGSLLSNIEFSGRAVTPLTLLPSRGSGHNSQQRREAAVSLERAEVIKNTLGVRDLPKYVSLEQMVMVCSLDEIKHHVPPGIIYGQLSQLILAAARESLSFIFSGGVEE